MGRTTTAKSVVVPGRMYFLTSSARFIARVFDSFVKSSASEGRLNLASIGRYSVFPPSLILSA